MYFAGDVDFFRPQYRRFPLARGVSCHQTTLGPGDALFYPSDFWHQTLNLDTPTVALTGTLVTAANRRGVRGQLVRQCQGAGDVFAADERLCGRLPACFGLWERLWGHPGDEEL